MDYGYPLLRKVFEHYKADGDDLSDIHIYSCQHLLAPQYEMYRLFIDFGIKPQNIIALGKVYSSNKEIIQRLRDLGIQAEQPEFSSEAFDTEHARNCKSVAGQIQKGHKNVVLDDGGQLIYESREKDISFGVEQTSSGFWKLSHEKLDFPVFNVARSKTKLTQESPIIGRIIFERIKQYVIDKNILNPKFLVIGLGPIGRSTLEILDENGFNVKGFDVETDKTNTLLHLKNEKPDIVVGATGTQLFDERDLETIEGKHTYHFISVSSSDREFPVAQFRKGVAVHSDVEYKNFVFVNNGFPITFKGNRYESTGIEMEKTIALLLGSVLHGIRYGQSDQKGVIDVPKELEDIINS